MERRGIVLSLLMMFVTVVTPRDTIMPDFTSVTVQTSEDSESAVITFEYIAPSDPFLAWYVDGVPLNEGSEQHAVTKSFDDSTKRGTAILSSPNGKRSIFSLCLFNFEGENCMFLAPLPSSGTVREELAFPWPDMTPGPDVKYEQGQKVVINAPVLDTPHMYFYSALLFSQDPDDSQGGLMTAMTQGMDGGQEGDPVTVGPSSQGGWDFVVRTDLKNYQGALQMNTTFVPSGGLVMVLFLVEPFSISLQESDYPFPLGYLVPTPAPASWACTEHQGCMVGCSFITNGHLDINVVRMTSADRTELPDQDQKDSDVHMLGPYIGYSTMFIPDFVAERDRGMYKCIYSNRVTTKDLMVVVQ